MSPFSSSSMVRVVTTPPPYQVFINFRGELRHSFISHLAKALREKKIRFFIDEDAEKGQPLDILLKKIEESRIALAIISEGYTESEWCLNELVKIEECMGQGKLVTIPIFYKVEPTTVKHQKGMFGDAYREKEPTFGDNQMNKWKEALKSVCNQIGFTFDGKSNENTFITEIVESVLLALNKISLEEIKKGSIDTSRNTDVPFGDPSRNTEVSFGESKPEIFGLKQRLEELKEKVDFKREETCIVGVVGMPGTGKTTLVKELYKTSKNKFVSHGFLPDISQKYDEVGLECLPGMLLQMLLKLKNVDTDEEPYETNKKKLLKNKVFIVLDGVSDRAQIQVLLKGYCNWTKTGSKIVIATSDKSLIQGIVNKSNIYVVPQLNHRDGLKHFHHYALDHSVPHKQNTEAFMKLSKEFVHYARGHPLALQRLGEELRGNTETYWEEKLRTLAQSLIPSVKEALQVSYDVLSQKQKDAFLDIACFRSHDLIYVKSLLDSSGPEFTEATTTMDALKDKFLISISDSRVEMHDLLYTFARELSPKAYAKDGRGRHRIWLHRNQTNGDIINVLLKLPGGGVKVRGIFLDLSDINKKVTLDTDHFKMMRDLRYLKFYSSHCPLECEPKKKIYIPDGLELPLEEVRCLHWLKFPLDELPPDFKPKNLVDLKLPYSMIERIWEDDKVAPKLKWVDLNHSSKLDNLSGLSHAQNLERLNLEGCTALKTLPLVLKNMASLVFLNLKGCTALESLPDINLISLKTLILSNCSKLKKFWVISETLEALYLDGTTISQLPTDMVKLTRLVKLNMKNCKMLETLPEGFDKLKDLQELVFSGCSILSNLPDEMEYMKCLQILLLDGTAITKIPQISSLERLCLSRNDNINHLDDMSQLSQLKWLDLKYCKNLLSIPQLPPNLQCLDAQGCVSLKTVANPVATHFPMEQIHSTFIFTNCNKLDRNAKEEITTYAQRKCQLLSAALKRCNEGFVPEALFSTCFPGCEVPSWFCHQAVGSELKIKLPPHWNENRFVGIALCVVVSFPNCQEQINSFSVTCKFNLESKDGSQISFDRLVGRWNKHDNKLDKMESDHVFMCYTRCSNNIKCLEDQHSGTCTPTASSLEFGVTDEKDRLEVLKCGLRLVYASDKSQKTNSNVTTKKDNNDVESNKTSKQGEEIELQESTPIRNGSFSSITSGSLSSSGDDSIVSNEALLQINPIAR